MTHPLNTGTERLLALLCGFVAGALIGGALGYTIGAGS